MIYQLPDGRVCEIPISVYLACSDRDLHELVALDNLMYGESLSDHLFINEKDDELTSEFIYNELNSEGESIDSSNSTSEMKRLDLDMSSDY